MDTLTLKDLTFVADSAGIAIMVGNAAGKRLSLSSRDAGQLEDFLRRHVARERRVGFRVRIAPLADRTRSAFRAQLAVGGETVAVRPVDLSLTGILLEVRGVPLRRGDEIGIRLAFEGNVCRLTGSVVRLEGELVALHFLESLKGGELSPPEALLNMYRSLETEWLRNRRGE